jgi:ubiquinone/menaquinone biosynthesis C-methylase UbiE
MGTSGAVPSGAPTPALFFETATAFERSAALRAAIDLDLFTAVGESFTTPERLALRCRATVRGIRILSDYLALIGFLTRNGGGYALTPDSAVFLDRNSPAYMGSTLRFLNSPMLMGAFDDLAAVVRGEGLRMDGQGTVEPDNPIWVDFARAMVPMMRMPAQWIADVVAAGSPQPGLKVLDIAAGHGIFGITIAQRLPGCHVVALDWPKVLEVALENARAHGVSERYSTLPGDAFELDYGRQAYDLVLLTNFLHHFDAPTCAALLARIRAALRPGGRAIALEFIPNEDRLSPSVAAAFPLMMLATTPAGDAYTFAQYERLFREAGFSRCELITHPQLEQQLVASWA